MVSNTRGHWGPIGTLVSKDQVPAVYVANTFDDARL